MRRSTIIVVLLVGIFLLNGFATVAQEDTAQVNKQAYLDIVAEYNAGNREALYNMLTDPFMMNQGDATLYETSPDDLRMYDSALAAAMPDIQMTPNVVIAQGDWVATEVTYSGTFTEPFSFAPFGPDSFPANNEVITWTEMDFLHFNGDGLVDTAWLAGDPTVQFGQMGIFPAQQGEETGTPLDSPAGYQALSADELAATFTSGMEARNVASLTDQMATGFSGYFANMTDPTVGWSNGHADSITQAQRESDAAFLEMLQQAMPDVTIQVTQVVAEGDWVAAITVINGTFTQDVDFFGTPLTHTDQPQSALMGLLYRYNADGQIVETWSEGDLSPILQGLGVIPPMGGE